jgi:Holliday junction resolvase RusA-like endonuclease
MIRFFCGGTPKAMSVGSTFRFKRNGVDTHVQGRRGTEWGTLIAHVGRQHAPSVPLTECGVSLTLRFFVPRPSTASRKVTLPLKRPDIDNLFHKLSDQWNGVMWKDDSQVVDLHVYKRFPRDGRTGVEVVIEPVYEDVVAPPHPAGQPLFDMEPSGPHLR